MPKKRKLFWQILPSFLVIILLSLTIEAWFSTNYFKGFFLEGAERELTIRGALLQDKFSRALENSQNQFHVIDRLCKDIGGRIQTRVTVILPGGKVIGDSYTPVETMDNHRDRPEVQRAIAGSKGIFVRYSTTLGESMMYIALPVFREGNLFAVVRTAVSISKIDAKISTVHNSILASLFFTVIAAAMAALYVTRRITRPVEEMKKGAIEFAKGNLNNRLDIPPVEELSQLALAMNQMASDLDKKIMDARNRSRELEAVHASMQEGVIAVDQEGRIITINGAASGILGFSEDLMKQGNILEAASNYGFQAFIRKALSTGEPVEDDIIVEGGDEQHILRIHSTALYDSLEVRMGTLIIFHDMTRIRRLETLHKDFAANVSHELKTPLTTIKGFIETLQQVLSESTIPRGAAKSSASFLGIIEKNVNRMTDLINDLLALARIERLQGADIQLEIHPLGTLIEGAVEICRTSGENNNISVSCPKSLGAMVDPIILEQAVFNLVDNAVKYASEGSDVQIRAFRAKDQVMIEVEDSGPGIDKVHLPKIFNRFYRVDKARSRQAGGTGLGLAIVKHVVHYHRGRIEVESEPGSGSIFRIILPGVK